MTEPTLNIPEAEERARLRADGEHAWGDLADTLPAEFLALAAHYKEAIEALEEISYGRGPYSRDPLTHADNCIENMKAIALAVLAKARAAGLEKR